MKSWIPQQVRHKNEKIEIEKFRNLKKLIGCEFEKNFCTKWEKTHFKCIFAENLQQRMLQLLTTKKINWIEKKSEFFNLSLKR